MDNLRKCTCCQVEKDILEFGVKKKKNNNCKECEKTKEQNSVLLARARRQRWLDKNLDKRKVYEQNYYINNIEKFKARSQTAQFKEGKRKYKQNRRHNDPIFRIHCVGFKKLFTGSVR